MSKDLLSPIEMEEARRKLGLTQSELADLLGLIGNHRRKAIYNMEIGKKRIHPAFKRLIMAYLAGYRPPDWPLMDGEQGPASPDA